MSAPESPTENSQWSLIPLTPEYIPAEHGGYVAALEVALEDKQIRNIALSGNYGVGKSSILRELGKRLGSRVVELSLSTLAPIETSKLNESVPIQATTPTNRIQQEIVKQLLYREDPSKTPASRFHRIERFHCGRELGVAVLLGLAVAVVFLLTGWTVQIAEAFVALNGLGGWAHLIVWNAAAIAALMVRRLSYGKLRIKQFSAGAATVTLDDNSVSYFDQYLDEIVYFFDVSGRDVVIFEDIDRFNDSHIFETLRALNTLLNASPQIKRPIHFIYAIKDSIFDRIGLEMEDRKPDTGVLGIEDPALAEAVCANRTKFFDLVIPVVPFITHRSARNLAARLLGGIEHNVEPELLDLAAQYVPDMRLLKNVRNEFIVFRDRVFSGDGEYLDLSETELFAMMLYKSTHLTDFEKIRLGTSNLDMLYKLSRKLVAENVKRIEAERRAFRQRLTRINGSETRSTQLGDRLLGYIQRVVLVVGYQQQDVTYEFEDQEKSVDDLKSVEFWTSFTAADGDPVLKWRSNYHGYELSFTRSHLAIELGDPLDAESWAVSDRETLNEEIDEKSESLEVLRSADMADLVERSEFLVPYDECDQSFADVAKTLLKRGLAYELVRAGYLNRNFTLYTSTFHSDRVSSAAMNFIIHHVERNLMDVHFQLEPKDVDAVVRERGKSALKESALYNIVILDRLLATDVDAADIMIRSLVDLGERQMQFLQAYLTTGEQRLQLIQRFTTMSSRVLLYLVNQVELDGALQLELVNAALENLPESAQRTDARVVDYLRTHCTEFSVLTNDGTLDQAERVGALFAEVRITLPSLKFLSKSARSSFITRSLYDITYENLSIAIANEETVALDVIRAADRTVYDYVCEHVDAYLEAVEGSSATIDASEQFIVVLEKLLEQGTPRLAEVVQHAAPECQVVDLGAISEDAWSALALHQRFPATFNNVSRYVRSLGIDMRLASLLSEAATITKVTSVDEDERVKLAIAILAAREQLPEATLRANLVASLELGNYLNVEEIAAEAGELFALLLKNDLIVDDVDSYERISKTDWSTRKSFIKESKEFVNYMTPGLIQSDLAELLVDAEIHISIKQMVIKEAEAYAKGAQTRVLEEMAKFAIRQKSAISANVVRTMAESAVSEQWIIPLLEPHLGVISREELFTILRTLEGPYAKLTFVGHDKPKIPNTPANRSLLDRLREEGPVSSYKERETLIEVHKKRK